MDLIEAYKNTYNSPAGPLTDRMMKAIDEIKDGDRVLEIGIGAGHLAQNLKRFKQAELCVVDISSSALDNVKGFVQDSHMADVSKDSLKFSDDQFDAVICLEVFEHLQNPYHALLEIQRVLKAGGKLILSIPNHRGGHLMIYPGLITPKFFRLFLTQNFLKVIRFDVWGPVWNKDNVGPWISSRIGNTWVALGILRLIQVVIRILQGATGLFGLKIPALYWCYFFICVNQKNQMDQPVWVKQLEQTSGQKAYPGWYNEYYHRKAG